MSTPRRDSFHILIQPLQWAGVSYTPHSKPLLCAFLLQWPIALAKLAIAQNPEITLTKSPVKIMLLQE